MVYSNTVQQPMGGNEYGKSGRMMLLKYNFFRV